jgi:TatA/E family protein of Tat protein translocase
MMAHLPLGFFGIGDTEMIVIVAAILIFFGGEKMPELAKGMGKVLREFKKATSDVEREFKRVMDEAEHQTVAPFRDAVQVPPEAKAIFDPFAPSPPAAAKTDEAAPAPDTSALPAPESSAPEVPAAAPAPAQPAPPSPIASSHRFRGESEQEFHSDI